MPDTPKGYPYPLGTDPVAQGADAIRALAEAIDARLGVTAAGVASVRLTNAAAAAVDVTLPPGLFTAAPAVAANAEDSLYFCCTYQRSATKFRLYVRNVGGTQVTDTKIASWIARAI